MLALERRPATQWPMMLALAGIIGLAWVYLLSMGWGMAHMQAGADMLLMPRMTDWGTGDLALVFLMWAVMMVAMMLPSALPMVSAMRALQAKSPIGASGWQTAAFVAGYIAVWTAFSAIATLVQWALLHAHWVTPMMEFRSPFVAGALLLGAGAFQFSPLKHACLNTCRSPLSFLMTRWQPGTPGAWRMGLEHGMWCTGCCWLLMALLFVLGVMNVAWIAALAAFVLIEKAWPATWPAARWISPVAGVVLTGWGLTLMLGGIPNA